MKLIPLNVALGLAGMLTLSNAVNAAVGTLAKPYSHRNLQIFLVHGDTGLGTVGSTSPSSSSLQ